MGARLLLAAVLLAVAVVVARLLDRRRGATGQVGSYEVPTWLDRRDFPERGAPWLVVLFSSRTCDSCAELSVRMRALARPGAVATVEAEVGERADLHRRYGIEAVPLLAIVDGEGTVRAGFLGRPPPGQLEEALQRLEEAGPVSPGEG